MPFFSKQKSKKSYKKNDRGQRSEHQMEYEPERNLRRSGSQNVYNGNFDWNRSKCYSTGDIDLLPYRFSSLPSINNERLQKLEEANSRSQERLDLMEKQTSQFMQSQDYTNKMVQNLCLSVKSLIKRTDDDLFFKSDEDDGEDDLISEAPHKDVVRQSLLKMMEHINTDYIVDGLYTAKAIDQSEEQSVRVQPTHTRRVRRLATILEKKPASTFEEFLELLFQDEQNRWLYDDLMSKYNVAKRGAKSKCCQFCYVCKNTDVRQLADHMYQNTSLDLNNFNFLVNDAIPETNRWDFLRKLTSEVSESRDGFINALKDVYPQVEKKIRFAFTIDMGTLQCTCTNLIRRTLKNTEPRTIRKRHGSKIAKDIKLFHAMDDQCSESTISKFFSEENESDIVPGIVATNRPKEMGFSASAAQYSASPSPNVEESPIIRCTSVESLGTLSKENNETKNSFKYLSFVLGLVILLLFLMIMSLNGVNGFISFVKDVPHRMLDFCFYLNSR